MEDLISVVNAKQPGDTVTLDGAPGRIESQDMTVKLGGSPGPVQG